MKILHTADLHLRWFDWVAEQAPHYDLLVIAGDLLDRFADVPMHTQVEQCSDWLLSLRTPTVVCSGNHDFWPQPRTGSVDPDAEGAWLRRLRGKGNIVAIDGDTINAGELKIAVNGWLQVPAMSSGHVDIIVSHAPPKGCACAIGGADEHDNGDSQLWDVLRWDPPSLLLAGHIHDPRKRWCRWPPINPKTLVVVPGFVAYATTPAHWVIDTAARTAKHSSRGKAVSYR
jgi:Icc-related predicted phosphoesterase